MRKTYLGLLIAGATLSSCIDRFEAGAARSIEGILAVEGSITNGLSTITLSRSIGL